MNRRRLLLGMGTTAAGAGAVFGSGAFTQVQAERSVTIGIDEDSAALLQLTPGSGVGSVDTDGSGQLVIDTEQLTNGGNQGFSVGSTVLLGETDGDGIPSELSSASVDGNDAKVAFKLTNNFETVPGDDDGNDEIDIAINLEDIAVDSTNEPQSSLTFIGTVDPGSNNPTTEVVSGGSQAIFNDVAHDSEIYFAILLETASTTEPEDIKGTVRFRAGPNLANEFPTDATVSDSGIVNVTQDTTHTSIQSAVDGANTGDLIQVGTDQIGSVTIGVEGLTLEAGDGSSPTITQDSGTVIDVNADDVTVDGLTVEAGDGTTAVDIGGVSDSAAVALTANTFDLTAGTGTDNPAVGIQAGSGAGVTETIEDNTFQANADNFLGNQYAPTFVDDDGRVDLGAIQSENTFEPGVKQTDNLLKAAVPVTTDGEFTQALTDDLDAGNPVAGGYLALSDSYTDGLDSQSIASQQTSGSGLPSGFVRVDIEPADINTDNSYSPVNRGGNAISGAYVLETGQVLYVNVILSGGEAYFFVPDAYSGQELTLAVGNFNQSSDASTWADLSSNDIIIQNFEVV